MGIFELTPQCNFDCKMCYVHLEKEQMQGRKELNGDRWIGLMDEAIRAGMMNAQLTGGEAMLHPEFDRLYLHLWEKGIRIAVMTNGLLLNEKRIEFFKKYPPASIQITIYGNDEDSYERLTGLRVCETVRNHIIKAKEIGCRIVLTSTPSAYFTSEDVRKAYAFAKEQELPYKVNSDLCEPHEETGRRTDELEIGMEEYFKIRRVILEEAGVEIIPVDENELPVPAAFEEMIQNDGGRDRSDGEDVWSKQTEEKTREKELEVERGLKCSSGRALFCINWKGEMMACLDLAFRERPLEIGFDEAWKRINEQAEDYIVPAACMKCAYVTVCNPCPALHAKHAPAGQADKNICERTKHMVKEGLIKLPSN